MTKRAAWTMSFTTAPTGSYASGQVTAPAPRARADAEALKMFSNIHSHRELFSVSAVNKAFAQAKAAKVG